MTKMFKFTLEVIHVEHENKQLFLIIYIIYYKDER